MDEKRKKQLLELDQALRKNRVHLSEERYCEYLEYVLGLFSHGACKKVIGRLEELVKQCYKDDAIIEILKKEFCVK